MAKKLKLNLGCREHKMYGFVNVDIREEMEPDVVDDAFALTKFKNNSVDLIYICHTLEHANRDGAQSALERFHEVLKPGGTIRISVPDMEAVCEHYVFHRDLRWLKTFFHGGQTHEWDYHRVGWDYKTMTEDLIDKGFVNVRKWNWRDTEHYYVDDYSQAYYPHMDKINGRSMSLNVEADKE
jgi:predicted SAM-dependent methyltransferase